MLSFQLRFRPDEVCSSGWKLVFHKTNVLFPENISILQYYFNRMRNLHQIGQYVLWTVYEHGQLWPWSHTSTSHWHMGPPIYTTTTTPPPTTNSWYWQPWWGQWWRRRRSWRLLLGHRTNHNKQNPFCLTV